MCDNTPQRDYRQILRPRQLALSAGQVQNSETPVLSLFNRLSLSKKLSDRLKKNEKKQSEKDFHLEVTQKSLKKMSFGLEHVPIFEGEPAKLQAFIQLIEAVHVIEAIGENKEKPFVTAVIFLKLSDSVRSKLIGAELKKWTCLKKALEENFKFNKNEMFGLINDFNQMNINYQESLKHFLDRLIDKLVEIKNFSDDATKSALEYAEKNALDKIKNYCTENAKRLLDNPQSLLEMKIALERSGLGTYTISNRFQTMREIAHQEMALQEKPLTEPKLEYRNFNQNFKSNFRQPGHYRGNFRGNFQNQGYFNSRQQSPRFFQPNHRNNNFNFSNQVRNRPQFQRFQSTAQSNYQNPNNVMVLEQSIPAILPSVTDNQSSRLINNEEYIEFLKFKAQKN